MEIDVSKSDKNAIELTIKGERHTFPNLLRNQLLKDKDVKFVSYKLKHPLDKDSDFMLKTEKKDPKKVLLDACKDIQSDISDFEKQFKKALK